MADRVILVCIAVLAAVYFYATSQIPTLEIGDPLGPKAFPNLLGIALVITGGMLFFEILRDRKNPAAATGAGGVDRRVVVVLTGVVIWTALYLSVFELLGYMIATTIYLIGLTAYFHPARWTTNIVTSVVFCVGSYLLFNHVLGVNLARGVLPF
ncbi:MAG TPA: tripartite tricarboxylate transporter TctB family protein [Burkholderiales bacterium]|nr:tripartite tricarboxylate transporter TctB family protein [Burkholderiales bacterium]